MVAVHLAAMNKHRDTQGLVFIPHAILTVHDDGILTVTVDAQVLEPPEFAGPWRRASLGQIIDTASHYRTRPLRIEIRENDGTTFTDLITPIRHYLPQLDSTEPATTCEDRTLPELARFDTIQENGFLPGEQVAVAVIHHHTVAAPNSTARALIDRSVLGESSEAVLLGRESGTLIVRHLK